MAKAVAICVCEKCGAEFKKVAYKNNRKDADSWEEWAKSTFTVCPDCENQMCRERAEKYHEEAKEAGLPDLSGTQKQITWAEEIRHDMIHEINENLESERNLLNFGSEELVDKKHKNYEIYETVANYIMHQESASWFIEHRGADAHDLLRSKVLSKEALTWNSAQKYEETESETQKADDTVIIPENATEGTVEVVAADDRVTAKYPKDDKFRGIVKDAGYGWNSTMGRWIKIMSDRTGSAVDRAADLANRLLRAGFSVKCENALVREKAVSGDFQPECKRWISGFTHGEFEGWLCIEIPKRYADPDSQKLYDASRKIRGSKWCRSSAVVAVPMAQHEQAEDFAQIYGYQLTENAKQMVRDFQMQASSKIAKPKKEEHKDVLKEILDSDEAVLADLEDD